MQAGRELDVKVAEAFGWVVDSHDPIYWQDNEWYPIPEFSTTWFGMGVLVEGAPEEGIFLSFEHVCGGYVGLAYDMRETNGPVNPIYSDDDHRGIKSAPHAIALVYLKVKGTAIYHKRK
ncbi:hypothetical protein [Brevibacillus borstelensis]|uniref:hypothetical protein n=1 Tax=Brevibacillus borstelensis TaxID=45462 RepID=UPI0030C04C38